MDFDLYAAAAPERKPPNIPNLRWFRQDDGTFVAYFEHVYRRMWNEDRDALQMIGFGLKPAGRFHSDVLFDPKVVSARTAAEVVDRLLEKHADFIADRARIDAGHADRRRRALGAVERGTAVVERHGVGFSRCGRIQALLNEGYKTDGHKLEIDRLCDIVEAAAAQQGLKP